MKITVIQMLSNIESLKVDTTKSSSVSHVHENSVTFFLQGTQIRAMNSHASSEILTAKNNSFVKQHASHPNETHRNHEL
jgi:hypothetical protein